MPEDHHNDAGFFRLIDTSAVGFWHIGTDGLTRYLNPAMCRLLEIGGLTDIGNQTFHRFFSAESLAVMQQEHQKRGAGATSTYEVELIGMHGTRRNVMISGSPLIAPNGTLDGLIGTFTDITGMRQAEAKVREGDQRLRSVFDTSLDAIGVSCAGTLLLVNPAFVKLFGFTSTEEPVGTSILDLVSEDERPLMRERVRSRTEGRPAPSHYLSRGRRVDGAEFQLEVNVSSYVENGSVFTVAILRDVSARLAMEEHLRQAQKMDAIGLMAGGIAHDFNNLLTVIIGCSELLVRRLGSEGPAAANAQMIHSTAERAAALTKQLLTISRRQVITPQAIDLPALVFDLAPMLRRLMGPGIDLRITQDDGTPAVLVDPQQIQQVVINLCVNARDAMPTGGGLIISLAAIQVEHDALRGTSGGTFVELAVIDNGTGMDAQTQARMFEPFFTTKAQGKGTGLGLSTVYSIVSQAGGRIAVSSVVGQGTTFRILLPLADSSQHQSEPPTQGLAPPTPTRTRSILLVDDDESIRSLMCEALEDAGFRATPCATPFEALARLKAQAHDLLISDVVMPEMNGWEFTRAVDREQPGLRLLLVSGYSSEAMPTDIHSRPRTGFLAKPFTPSQLIVSVRNLIDQR